MHHFPKVVSVLAGMLLLLACHREGEQAKYKYLIRADVNNCEGCLVKLWTDASRNIDVIDSAVVQDGKFSFRGEVPDSGFYEVSLITPKAFIDANVFLPADSIHITMDAEKKLRTKFYTREHVGSSLKNTLIFSTSPIQAELVNYLLIRDSLWAKFFDDKDLLIAKFRQTYDSGDKALVQQWADSVENMRYRFSSYMSYAADVFIKKGASPEATIFALIDNRDDGMAAARFRTYLEALPAAYRHSHEGRYLEEYLKEYALPNKDNQRFVGGRIRHLDFAGKTPRGEEINEDSIFKANKLTLVAFWASWCEPCRLALPKYYGLYQKYNQKGMGFIAVSMDNNADAWRKAIATDRLQVHHISELQGTIGEDMRRFEIKGIPANMLVDPTGKIMAVDISPAALKNKLQQSL